MAFRTPSSTLSGNASWILVSIILAAFMALTACTATTPVPADTPTMPAPVEDSPDAPTVPTPEVSLEEMNRFWADDDPYLGPEDAPVVIVEFSDYVCPYCGYFFLNTLPQILEAYPQEVRFVHRDFPILAEESANASLASACALDQDLFWSCMPNFFPHTPNSILTPPHERDADFFEALVAKFSDDEILRYVTAAGLDLDAYQTCLDSGFGREEIVFDIQVGSQLGIESVPFYVVNGYVFPGSMPFETWQQIIETALETSGS